MYFLSMWDRIKVFFMTDECEYWGKVILWVNVFLFAAWNALLLLTSLR